MTIYNYLGQISRSKNTQGLKSCHHRFLNCDNFNTLIPVNFWFPFEIVFSLNVLWISWLLI